MNRKNIIGILCLIIIIIMICINIPKVYADNEEDDNHIDKEVEELLGTATYPNYSGRFSGDFFNDASAAFQLYLDAQDLINTRAEIDLAITYLNEIVNYGFWELHNQYYPPRIEYPRGSGNLYGNIDPVGFDGTMSIDDEYMNNRKGSFGDLMQMQIDEMEENYELTQEQKDELDKVETENKNIIEQEEQVEQMANEVYDNNYHPDDDKDDEKEYTISGVVIRPGGSGSTGEGTITSPSDDPEYYNPGEMGDNTTLIRLGGIITGALKIIGIIASVLILVILGIKYMTGTIEEKSEYKKTMIPYIVGAVFLGAGGVLIELIFKLVSGLTF